MCNIKCIVFILFFFWLLILGLELMSTSIHFLWTVYNKKMSIYPIINYPIFSENTIIHKFRDTDTCLWNQIANCIPPPPAMTRAAAGMRHIFRIFCPISHSSSAERSCSVPPQILYKHSICQEVQRSCWWMWISYKKCQEKWSIYFHSNLLTVAEQTFVKSLSILYNFEYLSAEHLGDSAENSNHLITAGRCSDIHNYTSLLYFINLGLKILKIPI